MESDLVTYLFLRVSACHIVSVVCEHGDLRTAGVI